MKDHAQVIVVGGGPAGAVTALQLARAGVDVLVLERARFPRNKPCGDCLSAAAGSLLERLGLRASVDALRPARLDGWRILGPNGSGFHASFDDLGAADGVTGTALALPRARLDEVLLRSARAAGARVTWGGHVEDLVWDEDVVVGVRARIDGRPLELRAALTVGADGLRSRVSRSAGLAARPGRLRKLSLTAHVSLTDPLDSWGEMHVGDGLCVGVAPVNAERTQVNVTVVADAVRFAADVRRSAGAFFAAALHHFPALPAPVRAAVPDSLLASGPFDRPVRRVTAPGLALVGDAAGYFDPFTGQGIHQAMAGAELLAAATADGLRAGRDLCGALASCAHAQRARLATARRVQRLIETALAEPVRAERVLRRIAARPRVARALLAVTADLEAPRALLSPGLLFSFLLPRPRVA